MFPAALAWFENGIDFFPFLQSISLTFGFGLLFTVLTWRSKLRLTPKEGFAIVTLAWLIMTVFGALPFYFTRFHSFEFSYTDAYFETMSGLTTTGASILTDIESLPRGLLLWRSLTHWIGGMGIIVLFLAILPALGAGGFQLFRAEIPGPMKDKISPKIANTAKTLWAIYVGFSMICFTTYQMLGMDWFDAACHTFGTIATGGFSTKNASIAHWNSWEIDCAVTVFMFLSGCNFMLYLHIIRGKWKIPWRNSELRLFVWMIFASTVLLTIMVYFNPASEPTTMLNALRRVCFQVVSLITSTGFATDDYNLWPHLCQVILLLLMCTGACAGSTGGGIKVFRIFIIIKIGLREIAQLLQPRAVLPLQMDGQSIGDRLLRVVLGFVCLYFLIGGFFTVVIVGIEGSSYSILSLVSICISCLSNIGPGLDSFGPMENYAGLSDISKWCLVFMMLLGRLELYSVLVLFHHSIWKK